MRVKLLMSVLGAASIAVSSFAQTNVWSVATPTGGTMNLAAGVFDSSSASTSPTSDFSIVSQDWSEFAGLDWTLTVDLYITSAQLADGSIADDTIFATVGGVSSGTLVVSNAVWWTPDAFNTVTFQGTFGSDPVALESVSASFQNDDNSTHAGGANYTLNNVSLDVETRDLIWEDDAPTGGNAVLTSLDEFTELGVNTGRGNIGALNTALSGQWANYNSGNNNWANYAGKKWKFSYDAFVTSAQVSDANVVDDSVYYNVAGETGYFQSPSVWNTNAWTEVVWTGTLSLNPGILADVNASWLINDQLTQPTNASGYNFYLDNFKLEFEPAPPLPSDTLWSDTAPEGTQSMVVVSVDEFTELGIDTGRDDIGCYDTSAPKGGGDLSFGNYGTESNNWVAYSNQSWTLEYDLLLTASALADSTVLEDSVYWSVCGANGGFQNVSNMNLVADQWTTIKYTGVFSADVNQLSGSTGGFARIIINDWTNTTAGADYYFDNFKFTAVTPPAPEADKSILWNDQSPVGGSMALTQISDPFGTGQGNIGMYESNADSGQYANYNNIGNDWGLYQAQDWTFSVDIYVTAEQLADASITDDQIYYIIGGISGGFTNLTGLTADEWNTITWTGTFTNNALALANTGVLFLNNDDTTHPAGGPNYFVDNFLLEVVTPPPFGLPPVYVDASTDVEFVASEGFANGQINGQNDWVSQDGGTNGNWLVEDTAGLGNVSATNNNQNMTLLPALPVPEGESLEFIINLENLGTHVPGGPGDNFVYVGRLGYTSQTTGGNLGYDSPGGSATAAMFTFQAANTVAGMRLYGDGWNGPQSPATGFIAASPGDEWSLHYTITAGADNLGTTFGVTITNVTSGAGGALATEVDGVGLGVYNALISGSGGVYFETGGLEHGITGVKVLRYTLNYPQSTSSGYEQWTVFHQLSGSNTLASYDPDLDGLDNLGEYAFQGDPHGATGSGDQGTQPYLDGSDYKYNLVGDPGIDADVMASTDLPAGFSLVQSTAVTSTNGALSEYTWDASGYTNVAIKVEVEYNP